MPVLSTYCTFNLYTVHDFFFFLQIHVELLPQKRERDGDIEIEWQKQVRDNKSVRDRSRYERGNVDIVP